MSEVTRLLSQLESGDPTAAEQLLPLVYDELRRLASAKLFQEQSGQSLQATELVHEAYLRLLGPDGHQRTWDSRGHFFAAAAEAMRRILINRARDRGRLKRGGQWHQVDLDRIAVAIETPPDELLSVDEALQLLEAEDPEAARLVKLKFYAGLSLRQAAECLGIPRRTADRLWDYARAWLYSQLADES